MYEGRTDRSNKRPKKTRSPSAKTVINLWIELVLGKLAHQSREKEAEQSNREETRAKAKTMGIELNLEEETFRLRERRYPADKKEGIDGLGDKELCAKLGCWS